MADVVLWADSTVPVLGIVWNSQTAELFWINLTEECRTIMSASSGSHSSGALYEEIRVPYRLDDATLPGLIARMRVAASSTANDAYLLLVDSDDERRREGVFTCWTHGRGDARALILLRRMLPHLKGRSFVDGVRALNAIVGNPDIFCHQGNWIPQHIQTQALAQFDWAAEEIAAMYCEHERLDEDGAGWQRGGTGQALWHLISPYGLRLRPPFLAATGIAVAKGQFDAAFRLLVAVQWVAESPVEALADALRQFPELSGHGLVNELIGHVDERGRCDTYWGAAR